MTDKNDPIIVTKVRIKLHASIKVDGPNVFEGDYENIQLIEAMDDLLNKHPQVKELCMGDKKKKPGILCISAGAELSSLGLLDSIIGEEEEIEIKVKGDIVRYGGRTIQASLTERRPGYGFTLAQMPLAAVERSVEVLRDYAAG